MNDEPVDAASPKPLRRKRRTPEQVSERIILAAVAEFEHVGFAGATTAAIARRAEVTEAQIFRLFDTKTDLFRAAIFDPLNRHFAAFDAANNANAREMAPPRDKARRYIDELQDFMEQHSRMLMSLIVANAYAPSATDGVGELAGLQSYFERGAERMESRLGDQPRINPDLMVRISFAAVLASVMFRDWLFPEDLSDHQSIREAIADFVIDGLGASYTASTKVPDED